MEMKITNDALLTQLGYNVTEGTLKDLELIANNTNGFDNIKNHIVALNDHLKHLDAYVAMSSTNPYLKIKIKSEEPQQIEAAKEEIKKWAEKYKVELQEVNDKTYYILGVEK
jgi:adenylate cyclase class IV